MPFWGRRPHYRKLRTCAIQIIQRVVRGCLRVHCPMMNVPLTPIRFLYRAMDLYARKIGIVSGDNTYTYGDFGSRALRLASALKKNGIGNGDRVAFLSFNNNQLVEGYYGVPLCGGI